MAHPAGPAQGKSSTGKRHRTWHCCGDLFTVNCANCTDLDAVTLVVNMLEITVETSAAAMNWLLNGVRISSGKEVWVKVLEG